VFLRSILLGDWGTTDREAVEEVHERIDGIETERTDENAATRSHAPPEPPASRLPETARLRSGRDGAVGPTDDAAAGAAAAGRGRVPGHARP
jgi:hypothetical protein